MFLSSSGLLICQSVPYNNQLWFYLFYTLNNILLAPRPCKSRKNSQNSQNLSLIQLLNHIFPQWAAYLFILLNCYTSLLIIMLPFVSLMCQRCHWLVKLMLKLRKAILHIDACLTKLMLAYSIFSIINVSHKHQLKLLINIYSNLENKKSIQIIRDNSGHTKWWSNKALRRKK